MGMQNMMTMMGKNMDMHNMSAMMGQHMMFMQNMMTQLGKNMTAMQNMMTLMAKYMGMKNTTTIQGRPVSVHQASVQSKTIKNPATPLSANKTRGVEMFSIIFFMPYP
jgi:hypothetical protein